MFRVLKGSKRSWRCSLTLQAEENYLLICNYIQIYKHLKYILHRFRCDRRSDWVAGRRGVYICCMHHRKLSCLGSAFANLHGFYKRYAYLHLYVLYIDLLKCVCLRQFLMDRFDLHFIWANEPECQSDGFEMCNFDPLHAIRALLHAYNEICGPRRLKYNAHISERNY